MDESGRKTFGRRKDPVVVEPPQVAVVLPDQVQAGAQLRQLLAVDYDRRDKAWGEAFLRLIPSALFLELEKEMVSKRGHFAYPVELVGPEATGAMSFSQAVKRAVEAGDGIAIYTLEREHPDFVFTVGQLIPAYAGNALMPLDTRPAGAQGEGQVVPGSRYITANPAEHILPAPVRKAMREWLADEYGILVTLICLRMEGFEQKQEIKTMAFHFGDLQLQTKEVHEVLGGLYWFLPPDISPGFFSGMDIANYHPL